MNTRTKKKLLVALAAGALVGMAAVAAYTGQTDPATAACSLPDAATCLDCVSA